MFRIFSISAFLLLAHAGICQGFFKPGYIVLNTGDTITGEVEVKNWTINPETVSFKKENNVRVYSVKELKAFGVDNEARLTRYGVTYQLASADPADAEEQFDQRETTRDAWLRVLYHSNFSLYELNTTKRKYFFIEDDKGNLRELIYRVSMYNNQLQKDEQYKSLLLSYAGQNETYAALQKSLSTADYNNKDLIKAFSILNRGASGFEDKKGTHTRVDVCAGASFTSFTTSGGLYNDGSGAYAIYSANFKSTAGFVVGVGFTFKSNASFSRVRSRLGLNFRIISLDGTNNSGDGSFKNESYSGTLIIAEPNANVLFNLTHSDRTGLYLGPYFGYNIVVSQNVSSRFENPGVVVERKDFPPANGGYITAGIDLSILGSWGRLSILYTKGTNIFDSPRTALKAGTLSLTYG